jgi:urea carboxylase-associated protein 1
MIFVKHSDLKIVGALIITPCITWDAKGDSTMLTASKLVPEQAVESNIVDAGDYYIAEIKAGQTVRLLDLEGNQAADTLFFYAEDPSERYSAMDTIREQGNVYLTSGSKLRSNENRVMLEIVADTCGRHDTIGGACASESNTVRYSLEKRCMHACRDSWMLAIAENPDFGLGKADISHNINFFMNVPVTEEGGLTFEDGISAPGKYVELEAKMDVIILISNCPQLNNPCNGYNPTPIEVLIWDGQA